MSQARQKVGRWGEDYAVRFLEGKGYEILARNARTSYGEIDIIARQDVELVFVEVKTRRSTSFGYPEASVGERKQVHLRSSAQAYLEEHPDLGEHWRIDVLAVLRQPGQEVEILHIENAVSA
jgi:putative endonuclease